MGTPQHSSRTGGFQIGKVWFLRLPLREFSEASITPRTEVTRRRFVSSSLRVNCGLQPLSPISRSARVDLGVTTSTFAILAPVHRLPRKAPMPATGFLEATICLPAYINLLALCLVQVQVRDDSVTSLHMLP